MSEKIRTLISILVTVVTVVCIEFMVVLMWTEVGLEYGSQSKLIAGLTAFGVLALGVGVWDVRKDLRDLRGQGVRIRFHAPKTLGA